MKTRTIVCFVSRLFLLSIVGGLAFACATTSPLPQAQSTPIQDFKMIAGKWETTYTPKNYREDGMLGGDAGSTALFKPLTLTVFIREDGNNETIRANGKSFTWKCQLSEGKCTGPNGFWTLYEGSGKRVLEWKSNDGFLTLRYEPAAK